MEITQLSQLDLNRTYTYADYLLWRLKERVELLKGKIFAMSPAPAVIHQRVVRKLAVKIDAFLEGKPCELFLSPFDVRLPLPNDKEITTLVQPDLCVVCDPSKIDEKGCKGAPDLVIEILSPSNTQKEMDQKFLIYQEAEVPEYWLVHPTEKWVLVYVLEAGIYRGLKPVTEGEILSSYKFPDLKISTETLFKNF